MQDNREFVVDIKAVVNKRIEDPTIVVQHSYFELVMCKGALIQDNIRIIVPPNLEMKPKILLQHFCTVEQGVTFNFAWDEACPHTHAREPFGPSSDVKKERRIVISAFSHIGQETMIMSGADVQYSVSVQPRAVISEPMLVPHAFVAGNPARFVKEKPDPSVMFTLVSHNESICHANLPFEVGAKVFDAVQRKKPFEAALLAVPKMTIQEVFELRKSFVTDINEHMERLAELASEGTSVLELGVRGGEATTALLHGLPREGKYVGVDIDDVSKFDSVSGPIQVAEKEKSIDCTLVHQDDLTWDFSSVMKTTDVVFIDTFHVGGQLEKELEKYAPMCQKYIAMHDTTSDGEHGEYNRLKNSRSAWFHGKTAEEVATNLGLTAEGVLEGLNPAITRFVEAHGDEWEEIERRTNCNGLVVLKRKKAPADGTS